MNKKVTLYALPTCRYCHMAKAFFKRNNIAYEQIDVLASFDTTRETIAITGQCGVPVIDIDGEIIVGFDQQAIEQALGIVAEPLASMNPAVPSCC